MAEDTLLVINIGLGSIFLFLGVVLTVVPWLAGSWRSLPAVPAFGLGQLTFGVGELSRLPLVRSAAPLPDPAWDYVGVFAIYFMIVPLYLFNTFFFGPGLWRSYERVWRFQAGFTVVAMAAGAALGEPAALLQAHLVLSVLYLTLTVANALTGHMHAPEVGNLIRNAALLMIVGTANDVLVLAGALPWDVRAMRLGALAVMAAMAYALVRRASENQARLATLHVELDAARKVQRGLLPQEGPRLPDSAYCFRYIPAAVVGGDFYDILAPKAEGFGVLVADVTGHGLPAALMASVVKSAAAAQLQVADEPRKVMEGMGRRLYDHLNDNFTTASYAWVDLAGGRLEVANAGHPPLLVHHRRANTASYVSGAGMLLGVVADDEYETAEVALAAGDRVILYTDGLTEAASPQGELFSARRLQEVVLANPEPGAGALGDRILSALRDWTGRPALDLEDDLTLVIIEVPASAAPRPDSTCAS